MSEKEEKASLGEPYRDLYSYLIKGRVREENEAGLGNAFLGNWVEDDSSFLFFTAPSREKVDQPLRKDGHLALLEDYHFTYQG